VVAEALGAVDGNRAICRHPELGCEEVLGGRREIVRAVGWPVAAADTAGAGARLVSRSGAPGREGGQRVPDGGRTCCDRRLGGGDAAIYGWDSACH